MANTLIAICVFIIYLYVHTKVVRNEISTLDNKEKQRDTGSEFWLFKWW